MTKAIQIRVEEKLKHEADLVFEDLGLDTPTAIRLFLKKVVVSQSIPFELKVTTHTENGFTPEFEKEILKASHEPNIGPFSSAKEVLATLHRKSK